MLLQAAEAKGAAAGRLALFTREGGDRMSAVWRRAIIAVGLKEIYDGRLGRAGKSKSAALQR